MTLSGRDMSGDSRRLRIIQESPLRVLQVGEEGGAIYRHLPSNVNAIVRGARWSRSKPQIPILVRFASCLHTSL